MSTMPATLNQERESKIMKALIAFLLPLLSWHGEWYGPNNGNLSAFTVVVHAYTSSPDPSRDFKTPKQILNNMQGVKPLQPLSSSPKRASNLDTKSNRLRQTKNSTINFHHHQDERPLVPPFPDGRCGGTVVKIPRKELFSETTSSFLNFNNFNFNPFSSTSDGGGVGGVATPITPRDVLVWLPKEYYLSEYRDRDFPILYCHDGQNAMEDASSWTGSSWRLTGALTRLSERNMLTETPIVVLIPSGKGSFPPGFSERHVEYGDISTAHGQFVAKTLHPYIMDRFRVREGPEYTSAIGSSLGGQASLLLALRYPDIFGGVACLSPCFQAGTLAAVMANLMIGDVGGNNGNRQSTPSNSNGRNEYSSGKGGKITQLNNVGSLRTKRIYIDNGGDLDDNRVPMFDAFDHFTMNEQWWNPGYFWLDTQLQPSIDAVKLALDMGEVKYHYSKYPGGRHNERAWAQRIHQPLMYLYGRKH